MLLTLPFVPHGVWISAWSVPVKIAADGCDATLWSRAIVFSHTTGLLLPCSASTLVLKAVSRGGCKKRCARCIAGPPGTSTGKWSPRVWLNLSSLLMTINSQFTVDEPWILSSFCSGVRSTSPPIFSCVICYCTVTLTGRPHCM